MKYLLLIILILRKDLEGSYCKGIYTKYTHTSSKVFFSLRLYIVFFCIAYPTFLNKNIHMAVKFAEGYFWKAHVTFLHLTCISALMWCLPSGLLRDLSSPLYLVALGCWHLFYLKLGFEFVWHLLFSSCGLQL